jgi:hypothetical protein
VYVTDQQNNQIHIWTNNSEKPTITIDVKLFDPYSIFVTIDGDIYIDNGALNKRVEKWTLDGNTSVLVMNVSAPCYGLFIDTNDTLYCSIRHQSKVVKKWLNDNTNTWITVAGKGADGSDPDQLFGPYGIFVDTNFNLYVADYSNHRIQLFRAGESNGTIVAGYDSPSFTISLRLPSGIVLDIENNLFIVDCGNVRSGENGFRCLVGCADQRPTASKQLSSPKTMSFDSYGNMFVADDYNHRIQKFVLFKNSCGKKKRIEFT